ncbi:MAG: hypothetical protein CMP36_04695 [Rickettsiales bacterium]|nr:hypothetical protein [Rickettsiales bacterium]
MSKGFMWVCQNNSNTDYARLSANLAQTLKKFNKHNSVCVLTDKNTKINSPHIDVIKIMNDDDSESHEIKWANEYKIFYTSPFTHTIKLAADMMWNTNTDWWWNYLCQHDMIFAINCYNYKNEIVENYSYRPFHKRNHLPNIYSDLTYFRKSRKSHGFGTICKELTKHWEVVRDHALINCHDKYPSTDVVYALAHRMMDPTQKDLVDYPWFKFVHNKRFIHDLGHVREYRKYLMPLKVKDRIVLGGHALTRPWHYVDKDTIEELDARIF